MRFPHLAHRSAADHKLHSTRQQHEMNLISGNGETSSRLPAFSLLRNLSKKPGPSQIQDKQIEPSAALSVTGLQEMDDLSSSRSGVLPSCGAQSSEVRRLTPLWITPSACPENKVQR